MGTRRARMYDRTEDRLGRIRAAFRLSFGHFLCVALMMSMCGPSCAAMPDDQVLNYSQLSSQDITNIVPQQTTTPTGASSTSEAGTNNNSSTTTTGTTSTTGTSTGTNTSSSGNTTQNTTQAPSVDGVAIRWHYNTSLCMSRTSSSFVANDPIIMATCADDARQQFFFEQGSINAGNGYCLGYASSGSGIQLVGCSGGQYLTSTIDATALHVNKGPFNLATGVLVPNSTSGTPGTAVVLDTSNQTSDHTIWDLVGVGNKGGSFLPVFTHALPQVCLIRSGNSMGMATCTASLPEHRWSLIAGVLQNDSGTCLSCDASSLVCSFISCSSISRTTSNDQRWSVGPTFTYATKQASSTLYLNGDATAKTVALSTSNASTTWTFGCYFY